MSGFSADWLTLREPADTAARSPELTAALVAALPSARPLRVLDLGAGTGSNLRYLADSLAGEQHWLLVDHDPRLLARVPQQMRSWAATRGYDVTDAQDGLVVRGTHLTCHVTTRLLDLNREALEDEVMAGVIS